MVYLWGILRLYTLFFLNTLSTINKGNLSVFMCNGVFMESSPLIRSLLPYPMDPIEVGFKYLGIFHKPLNYRNLDWMWLVKRNLDGMWLVKKFYRRINNWSLRFTSFGSRLVLIRVVLVDILVYWLSLAHIHVFVLNIFRKKMFNLLWGGEAIGKKIHLMKWETVVKSKEFGGWDIKNLCWYSMALQMKSM